MFEKLLNINIWNPLHEQRNPTLSLCIYTYHLVMGGKTVTNV